MKYECELLRSVPARDDAPTLTVEAKSYRTAAEAYVAQVATGREAVVIVLLRSEAVPARYTVPVTLAWRAMAAPQMYKVPKTAAAAKSEPESEVEVPEAE